MMQSSNDLKVDAPTASAPVFQRPSGSGGGNKKGTSAERRATHNAIERARRESLNGRFLQLAASLPAISDVRRPSKSLIVNKSLDFVADALNREALYRLKIDNMRQENAHLRQQLNQFLTQAGMDPLPQPPVDELPVPMAEMRNKKRQSGMSMSGPGGDHYDLDDDDGLFAAGSEGEGGKTSPTSSCSTASGMPASLSSSLPAGVPGFTPISHTAALSQSSFLSAPANMASASSVSPGGSSGSEDLGARERSAGFEDAAGNWVQPHAFDGQVAAPSATSVTQQQLTYAGLAFSSAGPNNGLLAQASPNHAAGAGLRSFGTAVAIGHDNSAVHPSPGVAAVPAVLASNGQSHMYTMNAENYLNPRHAQQLQQQQQLQFQLQLQQQQQQQHLQQQMPHLVPYNPTSFFERAPLQSASFMTAV